MRESNIIIRNPRTLGYSPLNRHVQNGTVRNEMIAIKTDKENPYPINTQFINRATRRMMMKNPNKNTNNAKINKCRRQYIELRPEAIKYRIVSAAENITKGKGITETKEFDGFRKPTLINHYQTKRFGK